MCMSSIAQTVGFGALARPLAKPFLSHNAPVLGKAIYGGSSAPAPAAGGPSLSAEQTKDLADLADARKRSARLPFQLVQGAQNNPLNIPE